MTKVEATPSLPCLERRLEGIDKGLAKFREIVENSGRGLFQDKLKPSFLNGNLPGVVIEVGEQRKRVVTAISTTLKDRLVTRRDQVTQEIEYHHSQTLKAQTLFEEGYLSPEEIALLKPEEKKPPTFPENAGKTTESTALNSIPDPVPQIAIETSMPGLEGLTPREKRVFMAISETAGISSNQLADLFYPNVEQRAARHRLAMILHSIKGKLDAGDIKIYSYPTRGDKRKVSYRVVQFLPGSEITRSTNSPENNFPRALPETRSPELETASPTVVQEFEVDTQKLRHFEVRIVNFLIQRGEILGDELTQIIYPGVPEKAAKDRLSVQLSGLRKALALQGFKIESIEVGHGKVKYALASDPSRVSIPTQSERANPLEPKELVPESPSLPELQNVENTFGMTSDELAVFNTVLKRGGVVADRNKFAAELYPELPRQKAKMKLARLLSSLSAKTKGEYTLGSRSKSFSSEVSITRLDKPKPTSNEPSRPSPKEVIRELPQEPEGQEPDQDEARLPRHLDILSIKESIIYELLNENEGKELSTEDISKRLEEHFPDADPAEIRYGMVPTVLSGLKVKLRAEGISMVNRASQGESARYILASGQKPERESIPISRRARAEPRLPKEERKEAEQQPDPAGINHRKELAKLIPGDIPHLGDASVRILIELFDRHPIHEAQLIKILGSTNVELLRRTIDLTRKELAALGLDIIKISNKTGPAYLLQGELKLQGTQEISSKEVVLGEGVRESVKPARPEVHTHIEETQLVLGNVIVSHLKSFTTFDGQNFLTLPSNPVEFASNHDDTFEERARRSLVSPKHGDPRSVTREELKREAIRWVVAGFKRIWEDSQNGVTPQDVLKRRSVNDLSAFIKHNADRGKIISLEQLVKSIENGFGPKRNQSDVEDKDKFKVRRQPSHRGARI